MTEHSVKGISLHIRHRREALGYSQERPAKLSGISNFFLSDIEHGDRGFSIALLGRLSHVLGLPANYTLLGVEQVIDVSVITDMFSSLGGKYPPELKELLGAYLKMVTIAEKQDG